MKHTYKKMASGGSVKKEKGYTAKERKGLQSLIEELADPYAGDVTGGSSVTSVKKSKKRMPGGGLVSGPGSSQRSQPSSTSGRSGGRAPGGTVSKAYSGVSGAAGAAKGAYGAAKGTTRYAYGGAVESSKSGAAGVRNRIGMSKPGMAVPTAPGPFDRYSRSPTKGLPRAMAGGGMVDMGRKVADNYRRTGGLGHPVIKRAAAGINSENDMVKMGRKVANTYRRTGSFGMPRNMAAGGIVGRPARSHKDMKAGAGSGVGRIQKTKIARGR